MSRRVVRTGVMMKTEMLYFASFTITRYHELKPLEQSSLASNRLAMLAWTSLLANTDSPKHEASRLASNPG